MGAVTIRSEIAKLPFATPYSLIKTVAATGTPELVSAISLPFTQAIFVGNKAARTANTGIVYLGVQATDDAQFVAIGIGATLTITAPVGQKLNLNQFYLDVATAADGVCVMFW
jgi:hypothetical protein